MLSGFPAARPALVDFAHLITKRVSLLVCGEVVAGRVEPGQRERGQAWLKQRGVAGFYTAVEGAGLGAGARAAMTLAGLGRLSPNTVLLGFKQDWREDEAGRAEYLEVLLSAFRLELSVAILRCQEGQDISAHFAPGRERGPGQLGKPSVWSVSKVVGADGLDPALISSIQQFQHRQPERNGTVLPPPIFHN